MRSYVWVTFAFMGWGYYVLSGGSDFVPEVREVAEARADTPEIVTRADTATLLSVSASNVAQQPSDTEVTDVVIEAVALDTAEAAPKVVEIAIAEPEVVAPEPDEVESSEFTSLAAPATLDIREVAGSRVNMRTGPSTGFDVVATFNGGTQLEVLQVNPDGWANVATIDGGFEGWMAERLLTDPET